MSVGDLVERENVPLAFASITLFPVWSAKSTLGPRIALASGEARQHYVILDVP